jgi:Ca-activated chloride channel family protein
MLLKKMEFSLSILADLWPGVWHGSTKPLMGCATALLLAAGAWHCGAQETTIHMQSRLVSVLVSVTDLDGALVSGLSGKDFVVSEDGRPQQIAIFERQPTLPLNITMAIDTSGSVRRDLADEAVAAKQFAHSILRPQDSISLLQFSTDVREVTPFTHKLSQIDSGLGHLRRDFATALYDAVSLGAQRLGGRDGRRVLVIISDGGDTASSATYASALDQALRNEVMVYSLIDVPIVASAGRELGGEHALIALSEQTGGKSFYVQSEGLEKVFARISEDLRTQYLLAYYPKNQEPGKSFHRLQVTVPRAAGESFNLRFRVGYYAEPVDREGDPLP